MAISEATTLSLTMRPRSFEDVLGLDDAVNTLRNKLDKGEVPRGFLIKGPYGCGKTTLAHIIARYIQGPLFDGEPCVQEKNSAYHRKLDEMRTLADSAGSYPMIGTYNVIILDECQQITKDAQQVLLKELEVPKSPTVWILCTTDPEKVNEGIRSRCFTIEVQAMTTENRNRLIDRAAEKVGFTGNTNDLKAATLKGKVTSPRKILMAFETYCNGTPAEQAVAQMSLNIAPEYFEIAFAVCFGSWSKPSFNGGKPLGQMLKELDERLKKKPAPAEGVEEKEDAIEEDDLDTKSDAARATRAVVGAFLKGQILPSYKGTTLKYKEPTKSDRACKALQVLANFIPAEAFDLEWSGLMAALYRVNQIMNGL